MKKNEGFQNENEITEVISSILPYVGYRTCSLQFLATYKDLLMNG